MLFVDGENLTLRSQELAREQNQVLVPSQFYRPDSFVWLPGVYPTQNMIPGPHAPLQDFAIRAHYYTTTDQANFDDLRRQIRDLGFTPEVFVKPRNRKSKGVDISLAKDLLVHAFYNNYDAAVLIAGDGDYVPLVNEVKHQGKLVYLQFFENYGLSRDLHLAADLFFEMQPFFLDRWKAAVQPVAAPSLSTAAASAEPFQPRQ
jgi:hypothetical protein